jgi:hypothetical protein
MSRFGEEDRYLCTLGPCVIAYLAYSCGAWSASRLVIAGADLR